MTAHEAARELVKALGLRLGDVLVRVTPEGGVSVIRGGETVRERRD